MSSDQSAASLGIGRGEHLADLAYGHSQVSETPDHLSRRYLCRLVVPIPAVRVDLSRIEQPRVVIMPQRLHAQMRDLRKLTNAQAIAHRSTLNPAPARESS